MNVAHHLAQSILLASLSLSALAQQVASLDKTYPFDATSTEAAAKPDSSTTTAVATAPKPADPTSLASKLSRWVDVKDASFSARYRSQLTSGDLRLFDNAQERTILDGRLKFDPAGHYAIGFHGSSGRSFNWAYADVIKRDFKENL